MWTYKNELVESIDDMPKDVWGIIYMMEFIKGDEVKKYIGKKNLFSTTHPLKTKKELALMTDKRGSKRKIVVKESNWKTYLSSSSDIPDGFKAETREILRYCFKAKELSYFENKYLYSLGVLESDEYFNRNISGKFYASDFE